MQSKVSINHFAVTEQSWEIRRTQIVTCTFYRKILLNNRRFISVSASKESIPNITGKRKTLLITLRCVDSLTLFLFTHFEISESQYFLQYQTQRAITVSLMSIGLLLLFLPDGYAILMKPNKAETAVHGCHCPGDMALSMRKVLARLM